MTPKLLEAMKARVEKLLETRSLGAYGGICGYMSEPFYDTDIPYKEAQQNWDAAYDYVNGFMNNFGHITEGECWIGPIGVFTKERKQAAQDLLNHIEKELENVEAVTEGR